MTRAIAKRDSPQKTVIDQSGELTELTELTERARDAQTSEEFTTHFVSSERLSAALQRVQTEWRDCSVEVAWNVLRRIECRTSDEATLRDNALLQDEISRGLHALAIEAKAPGE